MVRTQKQKFSYPLYVHPYNCHSFLTNGISICVLLQTLEMLEKKEKVLLKKASAEVEKAKEYTKAHNKRGIIRNSFNLFLPCSFCMIGLFYIHSQYFIHKAIDCLICLHHASNCLCKLLSLCHR